MGDITNEEDIQVIIGKSKETTNRPCKAAFEGAYRFIPSGFTPAGLMGLRGPRVAPFPKKTFEHWPRPEDSSMGTNHSYLIAPATNGQATNIRAKR